MFFHEEQDDQSKEGFDELEVYFEPQDGVGDDIGEQIGKNHGQGSPWKQREKR